MLAVTGAKGEGLGAFGCGEILVGLMVQLGTEGLCRQYLSMPLNGCETFILNGTIVL